MSKGRDIPILQPKTPTSVADAPPKITGHPDRGTSTKGK